MTARKRIHVSGIVQGIGFRPFVYRLARRCGLTGFVRNTSDGVVAEVEGDPPAIERFLAALAGEHPPFAHIHSTNVTAIEPAGDRDFTIGESGDAPDQFVLVSPDLATCDDCRRDFTNPRDRRSGYPFTNCTNCGPRYTIILDIPYDRPATTMQPFRMCPACRAEYQDPADRRFHAQPNACPECGPSLTLETAGEPPLHGNAEVLREARRLFAAGAIVAIRGLGGFQLACDAENPDAVRRLRERKRRSGKPFALMARDLAAIERFCAVSAEDRRALEGVARPIAILPRRAGDGIPHEVAPGNRTLGVMLPYTPLHHLLFEDAPYRVLVMTSGNLSEEPIVTGNRQARERLAPLCEAIVLHDREIYMRVDDSVVRTFEGRARVLRRSRGYAPYPVDLGAEAVEVLACGGELKNTFCLTKGHHALLSQHIGDLENYETLDFFRETLHQMKKLFRVEPRVAAYDLHPNYLSTRFALELDGVAKTAVQHHHAHIAACMAENHLRDTVIGIAFDGTGYGTDGAVWGGEFLVADLTGFERRAHLRYVPLAGGDRAIREPWRAALAHLTGAFGEGTLPDLPLWNAIPPKKVDLVRTMLRRSVNTVPTSSCGRLFDAVASLLGLRHEVTYEGQAAIELEAIAAAGIAGSYPFDIAETAPWQIDPCATIRAIVAALGRGDPAAAISARFHNTVAAMILEVALRVRAAERLNRVCLSGGTFQNVYLLTRALEGLRSAGFDVYLHSQVPPNDGGLSLGQAAIANARYCP
ncbi:MAG: carbamoyltransferase HypF [Acidobacteria bacterium]|nr:carbamoyltransferase HypF [Acidobacteriota bacterium]